MSFASLGPGPAEALVSALCDGAVLSAMPTSAQLALTAGSANPSGPGVELTVAGYARASISWAGAAGRRHNVETCSWALPDGTLVGGIAVLNASYPSLANPLAWIDLPEVLNALYGVAFVVPAGRIVLQGYTSIS